MPLDYSDVIETASPTAFLQRRTGIDTRNHCVSVPNGMSKRRVNTLRPHSNTPSCNCNSSRSLSIELRYPFENTMMALDLSDPTRLRAQTSQRAKWVGANDGAALDVLKPGNGECVARIDT